MEIFETPTFTKYVLLVLSDDEYRGLQVALIENPLLGDLMRGGGGLRKLRWSIAGSGKRGGLGVIYYYITKEDTICMLLAYKKSEQKELTKFQLKNLVDYAKEMIYERKGF